MVFWKKSVASDPHSSPEAKTYRIHALCGASAEVAAGTLGFHIHTGAPGAALDHDGRVREVANSEVREGRGEDRQRQDPQTIFHDKRNDDRGLTAAEVFGPLNAILEIVSADYAQRDVCLNTALRTPLRLTYPQVASPTVRTKIEELLPDISALEAYFTEHPGHVAADRVQKELFRYAISPAYRSGIDPLPARSRIPREDCDRCTNLRRFYALSVTSHLTWWFLYILGPSRMLYLTTGFVRDPCVLPLSR